MSQSNSLSTIAAIVIILAANSAVAFQDDSFPQPPNESVSKYSDWLSADAKEFKIRLDVFMPNGDPASEFAARLTNGNGGKVLSPSLPIEGNRVTAAFAKAKESNRKVLAITYFTLQRGDERFFSWLEAHRQELEKEFVFVKIDVLRDENVPKVALRISDGQRSLPLNFAVFNEDGERLIDSMGPVGNTGYPGRSFEGKQHFRQVLEKTATGMTGEEIDSLIKSLDEFK